MIPRPWHTDRHNHWKFITTKITGWWFGCHFLFSHILGKAIPIDFPIFQRGSNHQPDQYDELQASFWKAYYHEPLFRTTWYSIHWKNHQWSIMIEPHKSPKIRRAIRVAFRTQLVGSGMIPNPGWLTMGMGRIGRIGRIDPFGIYISLMFGFPWHRMENWRTISRFRKLPRLVSWMGRFGIIATKWDCLTRESTTRTFGNMGDFTMNDIDLGIRPW